MEGPRLERTGEALDTEPTGRVFVVRPETELRSHPESHSLMFPGKKFLESLLNTREVSRGEWQTQRAYRYITAALSLRVVRLFSSALTTLCQPAGP